MEIAARVEAQIEACGPLIGAAGEKRCTIIANGGEPDLPGSGGDDRTRASFSSLSRTIRRR